MFLWILSLVVLALLALLDWMLDETFCNGISVLVCVAIPVWLLTACVFACSSLWYFSGRACYLCARKFFERTALKGSFLNVRDAQCSSPDDAERIRAVIAGREGKISSMIGSLIVNFQA